MLFLNKISKDDKNSAAIKSRIVFFKRASLLNYLVDKKIAIPSGYIDSLEHGLKFTNSHYDENFKEDLKKFLRVVKDNNLTIY